jgi:alkanesulfonate monooxygenase SsuD/methylene tetrahydromethanopterin reductase-like flavin-dependent oxidoreductase (luciferase family)
VDIGIGLPAGVPGTQPDVVVDWARRAEAAGFASVACVDRIRYDNYEPLMSLAAAAAVTERIELVTSILIAPLREVTTLAKQVATLDALSGGRLTLGVAIGARGDDYEINEFGRAGRGERLAEQLERMVELWEDDAIGPSATPRTRPRLLVGGASGPSLARMARSTDGYIHGGGPARAFERALGSVRSAWADAGRPGKPAAWAMTYFALDEAADAGRDYMLDYYAFTGPYAVRIADELLTSALGVRELVQGYADAGCEHLLLFPAVADVDQVDRLAEALGM